MSKVYDWRDSNLALFGSQVEEEIKKESSESERAWEGCGESPGLKVWMIEDLSLKSLSEEDHGKFYNGDSYIVLNTKPVKDTDFQYDIHFWIGSESTQDEYGIAAYKTAELDTYLGGTAIQHREVQNHESALFKGYFKLFISLQGGSASGFTHVETGKYKTRLLRFSEVNRVVQIEEIPLSKDLLKSNDVFILDLGLVIYQYNGRHCSKSEKYKDSTFLNGRTIKDRQRNGSFKRLTTFRTKRVQIATQYLQELKSERENKPTIEVLEEADISPDHKFFTYLTEKVVPNPSIVDRDTTKELHRLSDADGSLKFTLVKKGKVSRTDFDSQDVFIFDTKQTVFVWIGQSCSKNEKKKGLVYAHGLEGHSVKMAWKRVREDPFPMPSLRYVLRKLVEG